MKKLLLAFLSSSFLTLPGSEPAEDPELRERVEGGVAWSGEWPDPGQASSLCVHVGDNLSVEQREAVEDKVESATQGPVRREGWALSFKIGEP